MKLVKTVSSTISISPRRNGIGAEISGVDLSQPLDDDAFSIISNGFQQHRLLVFRGQNLSVKQQVAFSERFGKLEDFPDPKDQADGYKTVLRVSNIDRATGKIKPVNDPGHKSFTLGTSSWHIDSSFRTVPSLASMLYAIEMPEEGGDTMFADTTAAYDALPENRRAALHQLMVVHDFEETRRRHKLPPRPPEVQAATPPARHPLVTERENGRRALFLGSHAAGIDGMNYEEARAFLDDLEVEATKPEFTYRHQWSSGDLLLFDNICVMHQAMPYDLANSRRLLHRTTVAGDKPLASVE
ncbi:MAG: TauD/TfdA family dioxygenase [Alphaproteobacteria bacterium]|nr:TauD/TfdA family dioxygenase [Alphaproteobacteria bacterium]